MKIHYFHHVNGRIDRENGIIHGVSVITEGKAKGHDLYVDSKTLQTLFDAAQDKDGRVKTKLNHKSGIEAVFGYLENWKINGPKLTADLHMLKNHKDYDQTLDQIDKLSEHIGLSVSFSGPPEVGTNGKKFARAKEILSTDLVPEPAANPTGMFSRGGSIEVDETDEVDTENIDRKMDEELKALLTGISERLDGLDERMDGIESGAGGFEVDESEELAALGITQEDIAEAVEALRDEGHDDETIEAMINDRIDTLAIDAGLYDDGDDDQRSIDSQAEGRQTAEGGSGVDGGYDGSAEGGYGGGGQGEGELVTAGGDDGEGSGEFGALRTMITNLHARLDEQEEEAERTELAARFEAIQNNIAELSARNEDLQADNDALRTALETGQPLEVPASIEFQAAQGKTQFDQIVNTHLQAGKSSTEAITLARQEAPQAHANWLKEQGVFAN